MATVVRCDRGTKIKSNAERLLESQRPGTKDLNTLLKTGSVNIFVTILNESVFSLLLVVLTR